MKLRSELMTALKRQVTRTEMSQSQAAILLGVTQSHVSSLMRGKINLFSLDALVNMAASAGFARGNARILGYLIHSHNATPDAVHPPSDQFGRNVHAPNVR